MPGHAEVGDDDVDGLALEEIERLAARTRR